MLLALERLFHLPTVVLSCIGVGLYIGGPSIQRLEHSHVFTGSVSIGIIVFLMLLNIRGLSFGKWINNLGGAGTIAGGAMICYLAYVTATHHGSAFHLSQLHQGVTDWRLIGAFGTICYSLIGLDLASIMGDEIQEPRRNLPFAIFWEALPPAQSTSAPPSPCSSPCRRTRSASSPESSRASTSWPRAADLMVVVVPIAFLECISILGTASAWISAAPHVCLSWPASTATCRRSSAGSIQNNDTPYIKP